MHEEFTTKILEDIVANDDSESLNILLQKSPQTPEVLHGCLMNAIKWASIECSEVLLREVAILTIEILECIISNNNSQLLGSALKKEPQTGKILQKCLRHAIDSRAAQCVALLLDRGILLKGKKQIFGGFLRDAAYNSPTIVELLLRHHKFRKRDLDGALWTASITPNDLSSQLLLNAGANAKVIVATKLWKKIHETQVLDKQIESLIEDIDIYCMASQWLLLRLFRV